MNIMRQNNENFSKKDYSTSAERIKSKKAKGV